MGRNTRIRDSGQVGPVEALWKRAAPRWRRRRGALLALVAAVALGGCGGEASERASDGDQEALETRDAGASPDRPRDWGASAERAVRSYYEAIGDEDFRAAWGRLAEPVRAEFGGWAKWRKGYRWTSVTEATEVEARDADSRRARVEVAVDTEDIDECADSVSRSFAGTWELERRGGRWEAVAVDVRQSDGEPLVTDERDCPGAELDEDRDPTYDDDEDDYYGDDYFDDDSPGDDYGGGSDDEGHGGRGRAPRYPPPGAPRTEDFGSGRGTRGPCRDGTWSDSIGRRGACSHHGGVAP